MKKIKRSWFLIAFILGLFMVCGCSRRANSWDTIKHSKTLVIGIDDSFVPMDFREKNGQLVGFDVDLAKAAAKKLSLKADFQTIDWSMKETELRNGTIDVIWNGYTQTRARSQKVLFTKPYLENEQILVTKTHSNINSYKGMNQKILGVQTGSSGYDDLISYPKILKNRIKSSVLYDTYNEAFIDLKAGRINGLLIDSVYANYYLSHSKYKNEFQKIKLPYPPEEFAVGVSKKDPILRDKLNDALKSLKRDGTIAKLKQKWFK
ncbi:amino acid ABC transporter substrate-binding protein [uncultured Lactobacillus sp.]|uniref:amino acid ABC transporter substrate-binding protein n=1 Tax=uncultured Lactobacillus sp. TaxID=153152 RepID=UPI002602138B|nr:amino acid ABC transporter substrate-binding protein [uncultured Lactobacillus sp.]